MNIIQCLTDRFNAYNKLQACKHELKLCKDAQSSHEESLKRCNAGRRNCQKELVIVSKNHSDCLQDLHKAQKGVKVLTEGPEPPTAAELRVLGGGLLQRLLRERLGDRYLNSSWHFSDSTWLVSPKGIVDRYVEYLNEYWLPHVHPYSIVKWVRLNGEEASIARVDCDEFADFVQGITAVHQVYAALAWGIFWADVEGEITTHHAFNFIPSYLPEYDEETTTGLQLWNLEPQVGETWLVKTEVGEAVIGEFKTVALKPIDTGMFRIVDISMTKV